MATYAVDPSSMDDGAQQLRGVTESLDESLQALQAAAQNFLAQNKGQAIEGYDQAQQNWTQGMNEMHEALGDHTASLMRISENYVHNDVRGRSLFHI